MPVELTPTALFTTEPKTIEVSEFTEVVSIQNPDTPTGVATATGLTDLTVVYSDGAVSTVTGGYYKVLRIGNKNGGYSYIPQVPKLYTVGGSRASKGSRKSKSSRASKGSRKSKSSRKSKGSRKSKSSRKSKGSRKSKSSRKSKGSRKSKSSRKSRK